MKQQDILSLSEDGKTIIRCVDKYLSSIKIPNGVSKIGEKAFCDCHLLTSVEIPNSVTEIGEMAFFGCGIKEIVIPNSVIIIGKYAFANCNNLFQLDVPYIPGYFPDNKETFNDDVHSKKTKSIKIPYSVTEIGEGAFWGYKSFIPLVVDKDNPCYCSEKGVLYNKDKTKLLCVPKDIVSFNIPSSVKEIGAMAFKECKELIKIVIPHGVTKIGSHAFEACSSLKSVIISNSVKEIQKWAFNACCELDSIEIPDSIDVIEQGVFSFCSGLKSIKIPNNITEIQEYAFSYCTNLKSINIPKNSEIIIRDKVLLSLIDTNHIPLNNIGNSSTDSIL